MIALALVLVLATFGLQSVVRTQPAHAGSYTPAGNWWAVDSVSPVTATNIQKVRDWYQGGTPQVWGRYISDIGGALTRTEMNFAAQNGIYLYLLVADRNNSSPLVCGRDLNAADAVADGQTAIAAASALGVKPGAILFKDFEQNTCPNEPSAAYIAAWYQTVSASSYQVGFYGNSFNQRNQFPVGYCAAAAAVPGLVAHTTLAASEPEPNFNAPQNSTGPATAPAWAAVYPSCAPAASTTIWQYGEVGSQVGNIADMDEVRPGTPGLVAPDGSITKSASGSVPDRNLISDGGFNGSAVGWQVWPGTNVAVYPSGTGGATSFEGSGYLATNTHTAGGSVYQDIPAPISAGQTFCASVQVTTAQTSGGSGTLVLWLLGGAYSEVSSRSVINMPGNSTWTQQEACAMGTTAHTLLRFQFYPQVDGLTMGLDDVSVTPDRAVNGGFNTPGGSWTAWPGTNIARYPSGVGGSIAYEGTGYLAANTHSAGGSVYEDIPTNVLAGDTFCASAEATSADSIGAGGSLAIWLIGTTAAESSLQGISNLPATGTWKQVKTCITATSAHSLIRMQFYPTVDGPTIALDAVTLL